MKAAESGPDVDPAELLYIVKSAVARYFCSSDPNNWDEVIQRCWIAAWEASQRFDHTKGCKLPTFLWRRIRGEVYDYLRSESNRNRRTGQQPVYTDIDNERHVTTLAVDYEKFIEAAKTKLSSNIFKPRTSQLLIDYFIDGDTMTTIGERYGLTESRISQVISENRERAIACIHEATQDRP
jgi:RNA polymerase sigma factor (sigma-70 family)